MEIKCLEKKILTGSQDSFSDDSLQFSIGNLNEFEISCTPCPEVEILKASELNTSKASASSNKSPGCSSVGNSQHDLTDLSCTAEIRKQPQEEHSFASPGDPLTRENRETHRISLSSKRLPGFAHSNSDYVFEHLRNSRRSSSSAVFDPYVIENGLILDSPVSKTKCTQSYTKPTRKLPKRETMDRCSKSDWLKPKHMHDFLTTDLGMDIPAAPYPLEAQDKTKSASCNSKNVASPKKVQSANPRNKSALNPLEKRNVAEAPKNANGSRNQRRRKWHPVVKKEFRLRYKKSSNAESSPIKQAFDDSAEPSKPSNPPSSKDNQRALVKVHPFKSGSVKTVKQNNPPAHHGESSTQNPTKQCTATKQSATRRGSAVSTNEGHVEGNQTRFRLAPKLKQFNKANQSQGKTYKQLYLEEKAKAARASVFGGKWKPQIDDDQISQADSSKEAAANDPNESLSPIGRPSSVRFSSGKTYVVKKSDDEELNDKFYDLTIHCHSPGNQQTGSENSGLRRGVDLSTARRRKSHFTCVDRSGSCNCCTSPIISRSKGPSKSRTHSTALMKGFRRGDDVRCQKGKEPCSPLSDENWIERSKYLLNLKANSSGSCSTDDSYSMHARSRHQWSATSRKFQLPPVE